MDDRDWARHARKHRESLVLLAKSGDYDAGGALLQHAMAGMRAALPSVNEADAVAFKWLSDSIQSFFDGVPLARALCVEKSSRGPRKMSGLYKAITKEIGGVKATPKKPTRRGRPRSLEISDEELFARVSAKRAPGQSIKSAITQIVLDHLGDSGSHTAGSKVQRLTRNLQKRYSGIQKSPS